MKLKIAVLTLFLLGLTFYFSSVIRAEDSLSTPKPTQTPETKEFRSPKPSESPEPLETPRVKGEDRLENHRLEFCEKHRDEIDNRLTSLGNLVANILGKFDAVAARVEEFYNNKVKPTGKVVSNYDALVADIAAKRAEAVTALTNAQTDVSGFTCTGENPKGQIRLFRTDMQDVKKALHDYRTSIKNLIVAVRSVMGEGENETPKPTETPKE